MDVDYDERKFTELLLYVADHLREDRAGGASKLSKVLFFAEFAHVRRAGTPISGAEYERLPQGPTPRRLVPVRRALIARGDATVRRETFLGYEQHRLIPRRRPNLSVLSTDELQTIDDILRDLRGLTGEQVNDLSRAEPGWLLVDDGDTIPYEAALLAPAHVETPTSRRLVRDVAERYGIAIGA